MKNRRYAKWQLTWFRADSEILWLRGGNVEELLVTPVATAVRNFLTSFTT